MAYIIWPLIGVMVAFLFGAVPARHAYHATTGASLLAGGFGALIGGVIGDGIAAAIDGAITVPSVAGALLGATIFLWAIRRAPPHEERSRSLRGEPPAREE